MRNFIWFYKKYKLIFWGLIISTWIVIKSTKIQMLPFLERNFFIIIFESPKENSSMFYLFDIFKNLSYSYIAAFIFFLFQVIIPNKKREDAVLIGIKKYNKKILTYIECVYYNIVKGAFNKIDGDVFDDQTILRLSGAQKTIKDNEKYCSYAINFLDKTEMLILQCKMLYIDYLSKDQLDAYDEIENKIVDSITAEYLKGNVIGLDHDKYTLPSDIKNFKNAYKKMQQAAKE